ncbi:MAG: porin PorA family protein [Chloroflexi bacterium]|nr:porin PorA family protein [Chloroflexota bacterium]
MFAGIWLSSFSDFKKIPTDYSQTVDFQGTYSVLEERELIQELLSSPSINTLLANPPSIVLLADPQTRSLLFGDDIRSVLSRPELASRLASDLPALSQALTPEILAALANPAVVQLMANPVFMTVLADPGAALRSTDPEVRQFLASRQVRGLLGDPALLQALTSPAVGQLFASPGFAAVLSDPAVLNLLRNPATGAVLGDPVVMNLLGDPAALALLTDPRTVKLLSDPSELSLRQIPVNFHRVRNAVSNDGDRILLNQTFDASVLGGGQPLDQFSSTAVLAVDRASREYINGGTEARRGRFAFPADVSKNEKYDLWVHEVFEPVRAEYNRTEVRDGLETWVFESNRTGIVLREEPKRSFGIPADLPMVSDVALTTWTEPKTGITVDVDSEIEYRVIDPDIGSPVVFNGQIHYSGESVKDSIDDAKDGKRLIFWLGGVLPWSVMSLGFLVLSTALIAWGRRQQDVLPEA